MTDREERQHVIEVLKQMRLDYEDFWEENDTEEIKAFNYAIASIETDLKYDLLYEETSGQADKNDLGVTSGLEKKTRKNSKKLDCISRADAIKAIQDKAKKLTNEDTINGLCGAVAILFDLPSVTPQEPRWIPVSEKYPKPEDEYKPFLVTDDKGVISVQVFYLSIEKEPQPYFSGMVNVIAWMPLPKPYKAESEG